MIHSILPVQSLTIFLHTLRHFLNTIHNKTLSLYMFFTLYLGKLVDFLYRYRVFNVMDKDFQQLVSLKLLTFLKQYVSHWPTPRRTLSTRIR